jgi:hypothetical protein
MKLPIRLNRSAEGDSALVERLDMLIETQRQTNALLERLVAQEASGSAGQGTRRPSKASSSRPKRRTSGARRRKATSQRPKGKTKGSPALHDEIEAVLREAGHPLPANVIADRIRARGNYTPPRSLKPLSGSNVNSRVTNATYRGRFVRRDDGIWLTTAEGESAGS